jgi:phage tail protein X
MSQIYITSDGDMVDQVVWKFYGDTAGRMVERVLDANPGLADLGPLLPAGERILLPELPIIPIAATQGLKLWS